MAAITIPTTTAPPSEPDQAAIAARLSRTSPAISPVPLTDPGRLGISSPISTVLATEAEKTCSVALVQTLENFKVFEGTSEIEARKLALEKIETLLKQFVYKICKKSGSTDEAANEAGCKLYTFGSFSLGAHFAGADIDVLCLVPGQVTKQDFFEGFYALLKNLPEVKDLTSVVHAYVPVLKMKFNQIQIDLVFACISLPKIGDDFDLDNYEILSKLEDTALRSLNGPRVSRDILNLVPSIPVFQMALRYIKLWAKRRGLYSNVLGYFGGVAWALMVARICQLLPHATVSVVVVKFFDIYSEWQWPHPITLKPIERTESLVPAWNPATVPTDQRHLMPIITPAFPSMCATHNVTRMNQAVITTELVRAAKISRKIMRGTSTWDILVKDPNYFKLHKHYIQIVLCSEFESEQHEWIGFVESKLRSLAASLEQVEEVGFVQTNPFNFSSTHYCQNEGEVQSVREGNLKLALEPVSNGTLSKTIYTTAFYLGIIPATPTEDYFHSAESDALLADFELKLKKAGEIPATSSLKVLTLLRRDLPSNVFITPSYI